MYPHKDFQASSGWLQNFKKRFSVRQVKICGESLSARPDLVPNFQRNLYALVEAEDLVDDQIYNADESGLFWKMFPEKTLVHRKEKTAPGIKMSKQRLTFLCCANKSGEHKLTIAVIGKSKNPRSFKQKKIIEYYSSKNAWMTTYIFNEWFFKSFIPQVKEFQIQNNFPQKAVLILDNAKCHGGSLVSEYGNYKKMFLPPNCTSIIQPMDQNAIRLTKTFYKKDLLFELVNFGSDNTDGFLKQFSLKDACELLKRSWDRVPNSTIKSCWKHIHSQKWDSEDDLPLSLLQVSPDNHSGNCFSENRELHTITNLFQNNHNVQISIDEALEWINESNNTLLYSSSESHSENTEEEPILKHVKNSEALQCLNTVIDWAKERGVQIQHIFTLKELRNQALEDCAQRSVQTNITDFIKKNDLNIYGLLPN